MMRKKSIAGITATPPRMCSLALIIIFNIAATLFLHHHPAIAQSSQPSSPRRTDPTEVEALNSIFRKWNISSTMSKLPWNHTGNGNPCTGYAITADDKIRDDYVRFNPSILCDCSSNNGSTCHIIRLTAFKLNITGTIPDELRKLSRIDNLVLRDCMISDAFPSNIGQYKKLKYLDMSFNNIRGQLPASLFNLVILGSLQIAVNYLVGPLPAFIGNFSAMKYLSIGKNALSGDIPKEFGNLQELISLGMGMNNFSGSLPLELGNLKSLEQIYIDSIGVSGEIPPTFAKLKKLKIMWASDNNFGGKVPEFLGNLTNLETVRLQGNSFQGPIPSSLGNLQGLIELRLGDLSNGTSSLAFIANMKSLSTLILRNAKISDAIPTDIGKFQKMKHLDLSFNNLTGTLPPDLFNMKSLEYLFLGNNSISGNVPRKKTEKLLNIDLSYNELSGSIPPWAAQKDLQLNLVANNFDTDDSDNVMPKGLKCLQRNFPCYRNNPRYYSFAINCGGAAIISSNDTNYEADDRNLTTASYFVRDTKRWAICSTGRFVESQNPQYKQSSSSYATNTLDPGLFQTARLSPSSLRYYGLGMENGPYNVELQFAEIAFTNDHGLKKSSGRRIFDIYIQGNLTVRDFDIKKEAGGVPFRAIKRQYKARVINNFLEIHFFWAGKGTCCLPTQGYYGPLISAISVTPDFKPTVSNQPPNNTSERNKTALIVGIIVGVVGIIFGIVSCISLCIIGVCVWRRKREVNMDEGEELYGLATIPKSFSYAELKRATKKFNEANKLGVGGFGAVFKGIVNDGTPVAVKQLSFSSLQGKKQFVTEAATISAIKHRNLVKLLGCCVEKNNRLLVYEYMENGSLNRFLFGKNDSHLDWATRFKICLGTARGLAYLHEESNIRIIHRDIKASNILLDVDLNPKISDFGLAKLYDDRITHISTGVAGTIGYLAPEYAMRGRLTEKADTFAFGIVAFEIISGRPSTNACLEEEKQYLLEWAWRLHEEDRDMELIDPTLLSYEEEEVRRVMGVALLCTQLKPRLRPSMSRVVAMLVGNAELGEIPTKQAYMSDWYFDELENMRPTIPASVTYGGGILPTTDIAKEVGR